MLARNSDLYSRGVNCQLFGILFQKRGGMPVRFSGSCVFHFHVSSASVDFFVGQLLVGLLHTFLLRLQRVRNNCWDSVRRLPSGMVLGFNDVQHDADAGG